MLGALPPTEVHVEFDPSGVDTFIQLADVLEDAFPQMMVQEVEDKPARDGAFEVHHEDGSLLFSRLKEGRLPRVEEILEALEAKLRADGIDPTAPAPGLGGGGC
mmetsp:Transcript_18218/g.29121  ORF Transcript_18218/g.29121 Transcript_18218/m.29121 type:complete len:104 (+) Transcript_18218:264-575(+)